MPASVILGAQWGDEGKGKIVHRLSGDADVICRYQGGNNAGHTVVTGGQKYVLHLIPSGILKPGKICVIGNGVVVNPFALREELGMLADLGVDYEGRLFVSDRANLIMPYHIELDRAYEECLGIGTTMRGIGPAYTFKYARIGIRPCDLGEAAYMDALIDNAVAEVNATLVDRFGREAVTREEVVETAREYARILEPLTVNTSDMVNAALAEGKRVIYEGAQGALLDVDFGTYPYVTSSNPVTGGVLTGLGVGPGSIDTVIGVLKAYTTRVGGGPFPTELTDETGERMREGGGEFGASTGRPRRCGWFDAVCTRHALAVTGADTLAMMKLDVLDSMETVRLCTSYRVDGRETTGFPANPAALSRAVPVYEEMEGWEGSARCRDYDSLPRTARRYVHRLEELLDRRISIISTGPDEGDTILRDAVWS